MFCVGYGIYDGAELPSVYFIIQHKTLYNLLSPDPAVSCVADKQVSHRKNTHYVALCCISFSNECVNMGQMDFINSILLEFFAKLSGKHFTDHIAVVHSILMRKQSRLTQIIVHIHVPFDHVFFIKLHFGTSSVISDQALMYMYNLISVLVCNGAKQLFEIYIFLPQFSLCV